MKAFYRGRVAWGLFGFLMGAFLTAGTLVWAVRSMVIQEQRSPLSFTETVQTITANAEQLGWRVSYLDVFRGADVEKPSGYGQFQVVELCRPDYASKLLGSVRSRCVAMMPCSMAVYERGGQVYVASLNRGLIGRLYRQEVMGVMKQVRQEESQIMSFLAER